MVLHLAAISTSCVGITSCSITHEHLSVTQTLHFSQFPHPAPTLYYLLSLQILQVVNIFNYSSDMFTVCRSTISACSNLHSIRTVLVLLTLPWVFLNDSRYYFISTSLPPYMTIRRLQTSLTLGLLSHFP